MKILLGVDQADPTPATQLVERLRFANTELDVATVVTPLPYTQPAIYAGIQMEGFFSQPVMVDLETRAIQAANTLVEQAAAPFLAENIPTTQTVRLGGPTEELIARADELGADLVAVNGTKSKPLAAFFAGSVARGLVIGAHQSVLVAKHFEPDEPLKVVIATDHSDYANRCWEKLVAFWPRGIQHITILTAFPEEKLHEIQPVLTELALDPATAVREELAARNAQLIDKLNDCFHPSLTTFESRVSGESVHDAIAATMQETGAQLLILGAHGHSFLERLTMGSTSLQQALTAPYSVLVLRA